MIKLKKINKENNKVKYYKQTAVGCFFLQIFVTAFPSFSKICGLVFRPHQRVH